MNDGNIPRILNNEDNYSNVSRSNSIEQNYAEQQRGGVGNTPNTNTNTNTANSMKNSNSMAGKLEFLSAIATSPLPQIANSFTGPYRSYDESGMFHGPHPHLHRRQRQRHHHHNATRLSTLTSAATQHLSRRAVAAATTRPTQQSSQRDTQIGSSPMISGRTWFRGQKRSQVLTCFEQIKPKIQVNITLTPSLGQVLVLA